MKAPLKIYLCLCLLGLCVLVSCEKVADTPGAAVTPTFDVIRNTSLIANAGENQVIYIPKLFTRLDGSRSSDVNNNIRTYQWKQISGSPASFGGSGGDKEVVVSLPSDGVYSFELTVTNIAAQVSRDTVQVTVIDDFAPGVAPVFVGSCDTLILSSAENSIDIWSQAVVSQGGTELWLNSGFTYKQLAGPTSTNIIPLNGVGSNAVSVQGLVKGTYVFGVEVERKGMKVFDTSVVRVIDDTASGKEYYFESTWTLPTVGGLSVNASTPSRPEIFFARNGGMKKYKLWLKLHNSNEWTEVPLVDWMDAVDYYFYTNQCSDQMIVSYWGEKYADYAGKKVQMKVSVP